MKIISVIPARGNSKGIPLKNLAKINGRPMLDYTVMASLNSKLVNRTIVSTDHKGILKVAENLGAEVIKRPKKFAQDKSPIEPVIKHVLDYLEKKENYIPDIIISLQNTSPLRTSKHIDEALSLLIKKNFDSIVSGYFAHAFFWEVKKKSTIKPLNYNPQKRPNRQDMKLPFLENGAIYVTKYNSFKKTNCKIVGKIGYYKMPQELSYDIDSPHDLFIVEQIMKNKK
jgi:CMP-N-acetylneuraminic acid synthetase|tara:strand:+ start:330 stop:1010 length:681 start_codon:yes stop_codon:yes gene_type:complete